MPNAFFFHTATGGGSSFGPGYFTVTIDSTKVGSSDSTDFPMLFTITNPALKTTGNGGAVTNSSGFDVRVSTDTAGASLLSWETIFYDGSAGTFTAAVKIPTLSHTSNTVIYVPYGNASITTFQGNVNGTWNSAFKTRWGLGNTTTPAATDSTSNANTWTGHGLFAYTSGPLGGGHNAASFAGTQFADSPNTQNLANLTLETWINITSLPLSLSSLAGVVQGNGSATADKDLALKTDGKVMWYVFDGAQKILTSPSALSTGAWHHVVGTNDSTTQRLYIDGSQVASQAAGGAYTGYASAGLQITGTYAPGTTYGTSGNINGTTIAEVRLSNAARSADWILATYNNISSPATFYTVT